MRIPIDKQPAIGAPAGPGVVPVLLRLLLVLALVGALLLLANVASVEVAGGAR
jgi:hypothetical protein